MNRIFAMILSLVLILLGVTCCNIAQTDTITDTSKISQSNDVTSSSDDFPNTEKPDQNTSPSDETTQNSSPVDAPEPPDNNEEPLFTYNVYGISPDARSYYSERDYTLYCGAIDSILSHNGVIEGFASEDEFERIWNLLGSEFIPFRAMLQTHLDTNEPFLYDNGTATLKFKGDKAACDEIYSAFESRMNEALSLIKEEDDDWERIAKLFLYVSEHMIYGDCYTTYGVYADLYNAIQYKLGKCAEYAQYLNILADQIGFETILARSLGKDGFEGADHAWSMIRIGGQWYHFDACWQAQLPSHDNMEYFAFSTQDRYDSLARNNSWGIVGELEMFNQHNYSNEMTELPRCESGISTDVRTQLYRSVIDDYRRCLEKEIPEDRIESYIDRAMEKVQESLANADTVGIKFEIKNGTLNAAVKDLILNYSPQDLQNYPELEHDADRCTIPSVVLTYIDQSDLRSMLYLIIKEDIVVDQSVELILL